MLGKQLGPLHFANRCIHSLHKMSTHLKPHHWIKKTAGITHRTERNILLFACISNKDPGAAALMLIHRCLLPAGHHGNLKVCNAHTHTHFFHLLLSWLINLRHQTMLFVAWATCCCVLLNRKLRLSGKNLLLKWFLDPNQPTKACLWKITRA